MCPSTRSHMPSNTRSGPDWPLPPTEGIGANDDANFDTDLESGRSGRGSDNSQSASLGGPLKSEAIAGSQHLGVPATAVPIGFPHHGQHYRQVSRIESTKHGASIPAGSASTLPCRRFPFSWYRGRLSSTSSSITTCTEKCPAYGHGQDSHDHSHRRPSLPRRLAYRLASHLTHMDPVKLAYLRTSFIFAVSVLVTWTPSSINRVWALVHPPPATAMPTPASNSSTAAPGSVATDDRVPASTATIASALLARSTADDAAAWLSTTFALSVASSAVLPLQGLWNAVIYFTTSWATVNDEWRRKRERSLPMRGQLDGRQHNRHHPHHCHGGFSGNHHSRRTRSRRATGDNLTEPPLAVGSWSSRLRHSSSTTGRESSGDTDTMETRDLPITVLRDERDPARWDRDHGPMPSVTLSVRPTSGGFRPTLGVSGSVLPPPGIMARDCCSRGSGEVTLANVRVARDGSF